VHRVHPRTPSEAEDPAVLDLLRRAGGVWFTGGRQWRIVDAFTNTAAERLLHEVLKRGGAVGGSAAGASVLAGYLVRGNPLSNKPIMGEGYEEGFGLLPGAAVDPHFSQRQRFADMEELKQAYPQLVGLGLDEGTAIIVQGHEFEVIGRNRVCVFAREQPAASGEQNFDVLAAGDRYDLRERVRIASDRSPDAEPVALQTGAIGDESSDAGDAQPQPPLACGAADDE
jgi:cyanophycinase